MMQSKLQGLPRCTALYEGESLPSLMERLAKLNFYPEASYIAKILEKRYGHASFSNKACLPFSVKEFIDLAQLTQIDPADLIAASDHRLAPAILFLSVQQEKCIFPNGSQFIVFDSLAYSTQWRRAPLKFCSQCLSEKPYHRLIWLLDTTSVCIRHQCLLAEGCPQCQSTLSITEIVECRCQKCKASLSSCTTPSLVNDPMGLLAECAIQNWALGIQIADMPQAYRAISKFSVYALYQFVRGIRHSLQHPKVDQDSLLRLTQNSTLQGTAMQEERGSNTSFVFNKVAFACFKNWPYGFHQFLRDYRVRSTYHSGLSTYLGTLYNTWILKRWQHPQLQFVQKSFDEFLLSGNVPAALIYRTERVATNPKLKKHFRCWGNAVTAKKLQVSTGTLNRLFKLGKLDSCLFDAYITPQPTFNPKAIRSLKAAWDNGISLQETMELLGASKEMVKNLVKVGALQVLRGPPTDMSQEWLFDHQSVVDFFATLEANISQALKEDHTMLTLTGAAKSLACVGLNAASILHELANSNYQIYAEPEAKKFVSRARIPIYAVEYLREYVLERNGWMKLIDVAKIMGVKWTVVSKWVKAGLLKPAASHGNAIFFSRSEVEKFKSEYIFTEEAARILRIGVLAVQKWARYGRLKPVASERINGCHRYLFRRKDVERLRPENRLTAPQLARRMGIGRSQMVQWIKQGKVKPISGPGIDRSRQYLFLLESVTDFNNTFAKVQNRCFIRQIWRVYPSFYRHV